jgi:hypothetical protein
MTARVMTAAVHLAGILGTTVNVTAAESTAPSTYRHFQVEEADGRIVATTPTTPRDAV